MKNKDRWVVEVSDIDSDEDWVQVAECDDSTTAIAIADAMHSLMQTALVGQHFFQVRTHIALDDV